MNAIETIATLKVVKKPDATKARQGLKIGQHDVDFMVRVFGSFNVGQDHEKTPTVAVPYKRALAALCHVSGCTGKAGVEMIRKAMVIALADETDKTANAALTEFCPLVERVEAEIIKPMLKGLPKLKCLGPVTTKLQYERIN